VLDLKIACVDLERGQKDQFVNKKKNKGFLT